MKNSFPFLILLPDGTAITEKTKLTHNKKPFVIDNKEKLARFIYRLWKKQTESKSFFDWCEELNNDSNFNDDDSKFDIHDAMDNLANMYQVQLLEGKKKVKIDLFYFMDENLPILKRLHWGESFNTDFFNVVFGSNAGVYNMLYVIEYAKERGFQSSITSVDDEFIHEEVEKAEAYIQNMCADNILFGYTEHGDVVFAHKQNECWS